ncbi:MAG: glycosyltransferase family 2 protein [Calditrichaeota bacterium]|nr:MAG: glycosyltransferase family 2 protein [Calditrichota bacterium]
MSGTAVDKSNSVLIALPVYNEEDFLATCLQEISAFIPLDDTVVIDDGSTDSSAECAALTGVRVIRHARNSGKGAAILTALYFANLRRYPWIVFMDGDGQHPAGALPAFIECVRSNRADLINANRQQRPGKMPLARQLSNGITSLMISLLIGQRIHDSQCGFRALRLSMLEDIQLKSGGFQLETELILKLGKKGACIAEVPIETIYGTEKSSIHHIRDTIKFIKLYLNSFWW